MQKTKASGKVTELSYAGGLFREQSACGMLGWACAGRSMDPSYASAEPTPHTSLSKSILGPSPLKYFVLLHLSEYTYHMWGLWTPKHTCLEIFSALTWSILRWVNCFVHSDFSSWKAEVQTELWLRWTREQSFTTSPTPLTHGLVLGAPVCMGTNTGSWL